MHSSRVWRYQYDRLNQGFSVPLVAYFHRTRIMQENVSDFQSFAAESWHRVSVQPQPRADETLIWEASDHVAHLRSNFSHDHGIQNGFSQDTLLKLLNTRSFVNKKEGKEGAEGPEICVVCQDEYEENERIGKLHCGHEYHVDCISKWLLQKKVCPICKAEALSNGRNSR
ncbi:unnamed protein product [Fraxinus pennsylvanica]|uniref:RING-type E3 ubiquitin transferase n=1 Tax=Fraxinus pennsylvanica TaxID=56036 RepID=A0AAD2AE65_9LAMI|nr:unnamed protein product [Fraxinus pennsylvanica]